MGYYKYLNKFWKNPRESFGSEDWREWLVELRRQPAVLRVHRPTRIDRARSLGYKAKQGVFIVRVRLLKGGSKRHEIKGGRKPRSSGMFYTPAKSNRRVAEERAARTYPNSEVVNSYWLAEDGKYLWYEVIFADRAHPSVLRDKNLKNIVASKGRAYRGLTSAARRSRGN